MLLSHPDLHQLALFLDKEFSGQLRILQLVLCRLVPLALQVYRQGFQNRVV